VRRLGHHRFIAGLGHIAVGYVSGRLSTQVTGRRAPARPIRLTLACVALALLPDADVLFLLAGLPDRGLFGHRGLTHTPLFALIVGALVGLGAWAARRPRPWRLALGAALLVLSHGLLDGLADEGRGVFVFWPFSLTRYHFSWRPIPDIPVGLAMLRPLGLRHLAIELAYFLPMVVGALCWRSLGPWFRRLTRRWRRGRRLPARQRRARPSARVLALRGS
jgi:inner membrane protein